MKIIIQFERIEQGLFHAFANGYHIGMVARQDNGWFFMSDKGYAGPTLPSRVNAVMAWPGITDYQIPKEVPA